MTKRQEYQVSTPRRRTMMETTMRNTWRHPMVAVTLGASLHCDAEAGENVSESNVAELAKKLHGSIANLISVPIHNDWHLIPRTILPIVHAISPLAVGSGAGGKSGILSRRSRSAAGSWAGSGFVLSQRGPTKRSAAFD